MFKQQECVCFSGGPLADRYDKLMMTTLSATDIADVSHGKFHLPERIFLNK